MKRSQHSVFFPLHLLALSYAPSDFSSYQLAKNILCGDIPCFDSITDIYISSVAESGAAIEVTMKGFRNGSSKTVTKSGRNIKSQLGFTSHYFKTSSQSDVSNLSVGPVTVTNKMSSISSDIKSFTTQRPGIITFFVFDVHSLFEGVPLSLQSCELFFIFAFDR